MGKGLGGAGQGLGQQAQGESSEPQGQARDKIPFLEPIPYARCWTGS